MTNPGSPESWPSMADFYAAVQNPKARFRDAELRDGVVVTDRHDLPLVSSGRFASVYRVRCGPTEHAVRCFLHPGSDRARRYEAISEHLRGARLDCTAEFKFDREGLFVSPPGKWFPILKMEWVEGPSLFEYVEQNYRSADLLRKLDEDWLRLVHSLQRAGIGHGDLQTANVKVTPRGLRLLDYDGMFVPSIAALGAVERGHENFQSPQRTEADFFPEIDAFSAWVVHVALTALSIDRQLWGRFALAFRAPGEGAEQDPDALLFRKADFEDPERSEVFKALRSHRNSVIREAADALARFCSTPLRSIPYPGDAGEEAPPVATPTPAPSGASPGREPIRRHSARAVPSVPLPDWFASDPPLPVVDVVRVPPPVLPTASVPWRASRGAVVASAATAGLVVGIDGLPFGAGERLGLLGLNVLAAGFLARRLYRAVPEVASRPALAAFVDAKRGEVAGFRDARDRCAHDEAAWVHRRDVAIAALRAARDGALRLRAVELEEIARDAEEAGAGDQSANDRDQSARIVEIDRRLLNLDEAASERRLPHHELARERVRQEFLERASLLKASIPGVGEKMRGRLREEGVTTAADVEEARLARVPGITRKQIQNILLWREDREREAGEAADSQAPPDDPGMVAAWTKERTALVAERERLVAAGAAAGPFFAGRGDPERDVAARKWDAHVRKIDDTIGRVSERANAIHDRAAEWRDACASRIRDAENELRWGENALDAARSLTLGRFLRRLTLGR